jgi:uncharacterized membrane protein YfcA
MMGPDVVVLSLLALGSFFVRGLTGAASAIVFNAALAVLVAVGLSGGLSMRTGLYWMALANAIATVVLLAALARSIRFDRLTVLLLVGVVPTTVVFSYLLPSVELRGLQLLLGMGVVLGGIQLLRDDIGISMQPGRTALIAALPIGAAAGLLGGLFGMAGPVLLLTLGRWTADPAAFRVRFTTVTAAANVVRVPVLVAAGAYATDDVRLLLLSLPALGAGLALGFWAHRYVSARTFRALLGALVAAAGLLTVTQAL